MSNIGIMDGAYFVGRKEILDWLNDTLKLSFSKVEQTAFGGVAVQLLDIMYPGQVPIHKVNWSAKGSHEFVSNYKIIQNTFAKLKIEKYVDVDKLIKGLYMDNLEFMQWFKRFFEMAVADIGDYDPIERRSKGKGGAAFNATHSSSSSTSSSCGNKTSNNTKKAVLKEVSANIQTTTSSSTTTNNVNKSKSQKAPPSSSTTKASTATIPNAQYTELKDKNDSLMKNLTEVKLEMDGLEKERDFYFDKLRDIEMMLQDMEESGKGNEMSAAIFKILYATAEGFEPADDNVEDTNIESTTENIENIKSEVIMDGDKSEPALEAESIMETV